jgi:hypothetical protein
VDGEAIHEDVDGEINAIAEKATPVDADIVIIEDSAASYAKKKAQLSNLPYPDPSVDDVGIELSGSTLQLKDNVAIFTHQTAAGVSGGDQVAGALYDLTLNTSEHDTVSWASRSSNIITLSAGTYLLEAWKNFNCGNSERVILQIWNNSDSSEVAVSACVYGASSSTGLSYACGVVTIAGSKGFKLRYRAQAGQPSGLGHAYSMSSLPHVHHQFKITRIN